MIVHRSDVPCTGGWRPAFRYIARMIQPKTLRNRWVAGLSVAAILVFGLSACGSGETTVTVTETVTAKPPQGQKEGAGEIATEAGAVAGFVDHVTTESGSMVLSGWAASNDLSGPATKVTAIVEGKAIDSAVPTIEREDVVEALGKSGLKDSGFELQLPLESLQCGKPAAGIEVVGSLDGKSSVLSFGEGIEKEITESC